MHPAFIWIDQPPRQRLTHVLFKRMLTLAAAPASAVMHLFAHTSYHLRVNGVMLGYGPARSYPEFPEYDSYDILPHLKVGENVIAVDVAQVGIATFHHLPMPGVFTAWGAVECAGGARLELSTASGWLCAISPAHEPNPPRFSFAIGPIMMFDERKCPVHWDDPAHARALAWRAPAVVDCAGFGAMRPRSIPALTQDQRCAELLLRARQHVPGERIISFLLAQQYDPELHVPPKAIAFAHTYVYSPKQQTVRAGLWWGENYLNGRKLALSGEVAGYFNRSRATLRLKKGWNFLFMSYQMVNGAWDMNLAVPAAARLLFSATKARNGGPAFRVADPMDAAQAEALLKDRRFDTLERFPELAPRWRDMPCADAPVSPCRAVAWRAHGAELPLRAEQVRDIRVPVGGASLVFDLGKMSLGRMFVEFTAPRGTVFDLAYAEDLKDGRPHLFKMVLTHSGERHIARGGRSRMETFDPRGARYLELSITGHTKPVTIHATGIVSQVYPYRKRGWFECSDPFLNDLWKFGWNTIRLNSEDVITDTPWRERTLYGGDLLPETATAFVTSGDMRLPRRCIEIFLQSYSPKFRTIVSAGPKRLTGPGLNDYPMIVVLIAEWICRVTNDVALAERAYPIFDSMIRRLLEQRRPDGLFETDCRAFIDHHYKRQHGCICALNALAAATFEAWASLLGMLGKHADAAAIAHTAAELNEHINAKLWCERRGAFYDTLPGTDKQPRETSVTANAMAMIFGAPTPEQARAVVRHFDRSAADFDPLDEGRFMSAYGSFYGLGGLYAHGGEATAEQAMRTVFAEMIKHPTGTTWEHAHPEKSLSHAWSSAPTYYLSTRALGVRLGFPERTPLNEILIAPQAGTLAWARGAVPHPLGVVEVDWRIEGDVLALNYTAPAEAKVTIAPCGRLAALQLHAHRNG